VSDASAVTPKKRPRVVLVVAVAENDVIGQGGKLPWRIKSEMQHFRAVTWGKPIVTGRKTYQSFPRRPLLGRTNIVVTRDRALSLPGAVVTTSLADALAVARGDALRRGVDEISIVGGADLYAQTLAEADRLVLTRVKLQPAGDTKFPPVDPALWREIERTDHAAGPDDEAAYSIHVYERLLHS
jgi:dihydrofolate reductase